MPEQREKERAPGRVTIILTGGGTGGHVFPALAIAETLRQERPDIQLVYAGTRGRIEEKIVPPLGYKFVSIWISGLQRGAVLGNLLLPIKIIVSLIQSFLLMARWKPSVVAGTGGYVCAPVLLAASVLGIPTVLHESNSYPGVTTRLLAGRVSRLYLGFDDAKRWLPGVRNAATVGTPVRTLEGVSRSEACGTFGLNEEKRVLLVLGGSQGAAAINEAILQNLETFEREEIQLIWQTGEQHFPRVAQALGTKGVGWVGPFITAMDRAYAAADLVVCRAGATTLAELTGAAKPAVLIPYPHAAGDHQTRNAESLVRAAAAVLIQERELGRLGSVVLDLMNDPDRRSAMSRAAGHLAKPDAARIIAKDILDLAGSTV
ncbi:MAG: UDP-N-acetylglucosamine--N-acetylmuramyl-(pentapeptide) pyrophosphoryl-undecaprenol N-acetylglucosamine transferase [Bacteroidia bacterium]|nr:MAG: UDP-N-acetylglucosamine--N-acetylmuramyl-(pentapeptide) pyrophosphoryl-undecaprenol N-acetylglucosamine transferase [Bacteroidia bacterium]